MSENKPKTAAEQLRMVLCKFADFMGQAFSDATGRPMESPASSWVDKYPITFIIAEAIKFDNHRKRSGKPTECDTDFIIAYISKFCDAKQMEDVDLIKKLLQSDEQRCIKLHKFVNAICYLCN